MPKGTRWNPTGMVNVRDANGNEHITSLEEIDSSWRFNADDELLPPETHVCPKCRFTDAEREWINRGWIPGSML